MRVYFSPPVPAPERMIGLKGKMIGKKNKFRIVFCLVILSVWMQCLPARATEEEISAAGPDQAIDMASAPAVSAEGAVLMDIDTGVMLYGKNIHEKYHPASITKLLTCLVVSEHSELTDIVTFSHEAVYNTESGSSNIGIDEGQQLTMEQCYYAALLDSANEVSSGMAEYVGGSIEGFTEMMNEKVRELGGTDSNFVNAHGLNDDNHYTSAYDMALIGQAFAKNEMLLKMSGTVFYHIDPTPMQPDPIDLRNHHRMIPGCQLSRARPYEYVIGGKTGYTTITRNTLVTFAAKDGHRLVCVILKDENPKHYEDTKALLDYGFACYDTPQIKAQIDAKAEELLASQEPQEEETEETVSAGDASEGLTQEEMDSRVDNLGKRDEAEPAEDGEKSEDGDKAQKKGGGTVVLTVVVIAVVLAAVAVCGFLLYQSHRREQERRRRQAEIMARHRARKMQEND